jgi:hypothetical protein
VALVASLGLLHPQVLSLEVVLFKGRRSAYNIVPFRSIAMPALRCPSDQPGSDPDTSGEPTNFRFSIGDIFTGANDDFRKALRGPFGFGRWSNATKVTDGLSKTVMLGEATIYVADSKELRRDWLNVTLTTTTAPTVCLQGLATVPLPWAASNAGKDGSGTRWIDSSTTRLQTILPPNAPTCKAWDPPASSLHSHCLYSSSSGSGMKVTIGIRNESTPSTVRARPSGRPSERIGG